MAPEIAMPFLFHCRVGDGDPITAAVKVTAAPTVTAWLEGCVVKAGLTAFSESVAALLVLEPAEFVATAVYVPTSALVTPLRDNVALVPPEIGTPFLFH